MSERHEGSTPTGDPPGDPDRPDGPSSPSPLPTPPATGDARVDAALASLHPLAGVDLDAHLAAGEQVHLVLQERLSAPGGE